MDHPTSPPRLPRVLIVGLVSLLVLLGFIIIIRLAGFRNAVPSSQPPDALANSSDKCVACHRQSSPGIVQEYGHSMMAASKVGCSDCHEVASNYPGATAHEGTYILASPTTAKCQRCHPAETAQYLQSRHSLPAYVAWAGSKDLSPALMTQYQSIPEGTFAPDKARNAIAVLEGGDVTTFACETCHSIGKPAPDASVGRCQACHLRHAFSLEQVRKPETCNACHIGPDHPQWEIYQESPHGIAYATSGQTWNWNAEPGTLTVKEFPAPTCATCHISGFGGAGTTHDVGDRLDWYLFASTSQQRPAWQDNRVRMQSVCLACHNQTFVNDFYARADKATTAVNGYVAQSQQIMQPLRDQNLITPTQFDEPIEFTEFEVWHHWGRTTKFGSWMQGPDYAQWHGAYEAIKGLVDLKDQVQQILKAAGK
jgi:hydroxylamine dehydrogenase